MEERKIVVTARLDVVAAGTASREIGRMTDKRGIAPNAGSGLIAIRSGTAR
jgi:hypothetical protein